MGYDEGCVLGAKTTVSSEVEHQTVDLGVAGSIPVPQGESPAVTRVSVPYEDPREAGVRFDRLPAWKQRRIARARVQSSPQGGAATRLDRDRSPCAAAALDECLAVRRYRLHRQLAQGSRRACCATAVDYRGAPCTETAGGQFAGASSSETPHLQV